MGNLMDYLDWRGDLTFQQSPFNEVDNLILSELSFLSFHGSVPQEGPGPELWEAAERFFADGAPADLGVLVPDSIPEMLRKMAASRRFRSVRLGCFEERLDEGVGEQFAALAAETGDGAVYLSFRGTDDTLTGWKEDFALTYLPEVPAQLRAADYVRRAAGAYPRRRLRLGGHSKGGNLAVYAAVFAPAAVCRRITDVWSNDGPGFVRTLRDQPGHRLLEGRIHSIVPKSSVVGMLLEHEERLLVVDSDQLGLMQHDGFSWQVLGNRFVRLRELTPQALESDQELRTLVREMDTERRARFVEALFQVLTASGARTLSELKTDSLRSAGAMARALGNMDREPREDLLRFLRLLLKSNLRLTLEGIQEEGRRRYRERTREQQGRGGER